MTTKTLNQTRGMRDMDEFYCEKLLAKLTEISEHLGGICEVLNKPQPLFQQHKPTGTLRDFTSSELMAEYQRRDGC